MKTVHGVKNFEEVIMSNGRMLREKDEEGNRSDLICGFI